MDGAARRARTSRLVSLPVLAVGLAASWLLSRAAVARFWDYSPASLPERFPWGPVTEVGARRFEEAMGFLVLALLICPVLNGVLLPALRDRAAGRR